MQDIRYALAVATLTLGIGANTAIFSLLYQYLLRPLPYPDAERLVFIWNTYPLMGLPQARVSIPDYIDRKTQASAIEDATLFTTRGLSLAAEGEPVQVRGLAVTPSFFSTLRRQPFLGRAFADGEAQPGGGQVRDPDLQHLELPICLGPLDRRPDDSAGRGALPGGRRVAGRLRAAFA